MQMTPDGGRADMIQRSHLADGLFVLQIGLSNKRRNKPSMVSKKLAVAIFAFVELNTMVQAIFLHVGRLAMRTF